MYEPIKAYQMNTPCMLLIPTITKVYGVTTKAFEEKAQFNCNFSSYGGTESQNDDVITIQDTAQVITFYNPDIKANCRIKRLTDGAAFDILGEPENLEMRNKLISFKVQRVKGGA